jgi:CHASE1-domain containing sensor protein
LAQKYKMKYDNLNELELNKTETIKKKLKSEIDEELKYQELDKAMIQMSINKAWDKKKLIQIIEPLDEYEKK